MSIDERQKRLWLLEFELNGFVVLRNFLPVEYVTRLHDEMVPLLEGEFEKAQQSGAAGRGTNRIAFDVALYGDTLGGALGDPRFRKNPVVEELATAILGEWRPGWTQVEAAFPGSAYMTWHSDQTPEETPDMSAPHEVVRFTYNIPLVDFTWATGAMEVIPGSHRLRRDFISDYDDALGLPRLHEHRLELYRGDAVVRDGNILHRGAPNVSGFPRPMLDQTYKKVAGS